MFTTLIVQPIFNLLVFIYAILPGHNFGTALIIFTIVIRLLLWPLVKKQLHHTKFLRQIQPELKRIKKEAAGDRQKESQMMLELYKERGISPLGPIGPLLLQLPILFGLFAGLQKIVHDKSALISFSYPFVQNLPWMQHLAHNLNDFDATLFGVVDLTKPALAGSTIYWPAMVIVIAGAVVQFLTSRQLMPHDKEARGLRAILTDARTGKQADQSEVNAAVGRSTQFFLPALIVLFTIHLPSLLALYMLVGSAVAYVQQWYVLREDETEMEALADNKKVSGKSVDTIPEAEVVTKPKPKTAKKKSSKKKRRK